MADKQARMTTAMVLAAGLGQRMRPLTADRPKPLVEVDGRALIDRVLDRLAAGGIETAVVNVHYLGEQIIDALAARERPRIVISDERDELLDTGGGVAHVDCFLPPQRGPHPAVVSKSLSTAI